MIATRHRLVGVLLLATVSVAVCAVSLAHAQAPVHDVCQAASTWPHSAPPSVTDAAVLAGPSERSVTVLPSIAVFGALWEPRAMIARWLVIEPLAPRAPPA